MGGSASAEGESSLLFSLFGKLGITVTIHGSFSDCATVTETLQFSVPIDDCWKHAARDERYVSKVTGAVTEAAVVDYWDCTFANGMIGTVRTECGTQTSTGWADNVASRYVNYSEWPECAGGPPQTEDPRNQQCCTPLEPCQVLEPGQNPCCGCPSNS